MTTAHRTTSALFCAALWLTSCGHDKASSGAVSVSESGVSVTSEQDLCGVNAFRATNSSNQPHNVEFSVGFHHQDELVEAAGPFSWSLPPGFSDIIIFDLPANFWEGYEWENLIDFECRIHDPVIASAS